MGYLNDVPAGIFLRAVFKMIYIFFQLVTRAMLPMTFKNRHAYSIICISGKVER